MRSALGVILALGGMALLAPVLGVADPLLTDIGQALQPPSRRHWFGTDAMGRDVFARVIHAGRLDLGLACAGVALALGIGAVLGAVAGWRGGVFDRLSIWAVDLLLALPIYLLGMAIALMIGNSLWVVVWATAFINLPLFIRLTRMEVRRLKGSLWVDAARMAGEAEAAILRHRILPKLAPLLAVQASTSLGWAILNAAGLSFIGLGVRPPAPEWGIMIAEGSRYLLAGHWWLVLFPGLALGLAVMAFQLLGDGLRVRFAKGQS